MTKKGRERIYDLAPSGDGAIRKLIAHIEGISGFREVALAAFKPHIEDKGE